MCGFARSQSEIFSKLRLLEIQSTFYKSVRLKTAERWRSRAPSDFSFTVKASQLITHPPTSPTYRKAGLKIGAKDRYGLFRPTEEVFDAWRKTVQVAKALACKVILFQSPASFQPVERNKRNMEEFFGSIERDFVLAWEPRGNWHSATVENLCNKLELIHCVDPFKENTTTKKTAYFRLHGSPPGKRRYYHTYTEEQLQSILDKAKVFERCFILFNNVTMFEDALRFNRLRWELVRGKENILKHDNKGKNI